jgi:hypothetical protein
MPTPSPTIQTGAQIYLHILTQVPVSPPLPLYRCVRVVQTCSVRCTCTCVRVVQCAVCTRAHGAVCERARAVCACVYGVLEYSSRRATVHQGATPSGKSRHRACVTSTPTPLPCSGSAAFALPNQPGQLSSASPRGGTPSFPNIGAIPASPRPGQRCGENS